MSKSSTNQIEQDEKKILNELSKNANRSINDIAKTLGFSRQKVWRVIKNLEKNNTIWGYAAVVDQEKINKKRYLMLMKRSNKPIAEETLNLIVSRDLAKQVGNTGVEIITSSYMNGLYDWVVCFNATDIRVAKNLVETFNKLFEGYIIETHLLEEMFSTVTFGINNPEIKKFKDFFKV
jgi:DNA-binding Lrp family transcriptional regulator